MANERARRVEELFAAALARAPEERDGWLASAVGSAADLKAEVDSLLSHFDPGSGFLSRPAVIDELDSPQRMPSRIGSFRVLEELGRGGMGVVYLAEQDQPRRMVALKVLATGYATERSLRSFHREAEILARLHHPGIAQVFEAGTYDVGPGAQPYFAMELVRGNSITHFALARGLDTRSRLRLFADVCDAVDHAHRRGIVHRDLKPTNVLVDESSDTPQIKVLDFGIARAVDGDVATFLSRTSTGQLIGTLPYMSPEQASADPSAIAPRSDVYALGVLGYQLLCGQLPLDVVGQPLHEAVRIVREDEPTPASQVLPSLRGDVETILGKALAKEPARRYASAGELAADVRRHLTDRPILACPPSSTYLFTRFARRNRVLVAGVAGVFVALSAGLGTTAWQAYEAGRERDRANEGMRRVAAESARASAIARFQREMLARVQPENDGREVKLAYVLDAAAAALPGDLAQDPAAEGGVRKTLAESYHSLGLLGAAEEQFRAARTLLVSARGARDEEAIDALAWLGNTVADRGHLEEAIDMLERAHADAIASLGLARFETLVIEMSLAQLYILAGRDDEGEALARQNLERRIALLGEEDLRTVDALAMLGDILLRRDRLNEAEVLIRRARGLGIASRGERHPITLTQTAMLASVLQRAGAIDEPEALYRRAIDAGREVLGEEHFEVQAWKHNLGTLLEAKGEWIEAEALMREVHTATGRTLGPDHDDSRTALKSLVKLLTREGRFLEAEAMLEAAREGICDSLSEPGELLDFYARQLAELRASHGLGEGSARSER